MGPWLIALVLAVGATTTPTGRKYLRKTARGVVKAGYTVADKGTCVLAEAKERVSDLVEEVRSEQRESQNGDGEDHKSVSGSKTSKKKHKAEE
jgi:hypothetical protein